MFAFILKGAMAPLVNYIVTNGFSLFAPAFSIVGTLGIRLLVPMLVIDTTFLTLCFIMCTCYNGLLMFVVGFSSLKLEEDIAHYFSLIIPAHNEESVIEGTLQQVLRMNYPSELFEVIVINDCSSDSTEHVVRSFQTEHPNVKLINILPMNGGHGKGAAPNVGFRDFLFTWRGPEVEPRHRWIIGVFDADEHPQPDMLRRVSFEFKEQRVGAVQTLVRIRNHRSSFLAKLQNIAFLFFSQVTQFSRTFFRGSVALRGTGQFVRATALDTVTSPRTEQCWTVNSFTEDLDIGIRLNLEQWDVRYVRSMAHVRKGECL